MNDPDSPIGDVTQHNERLFNAVEKALVRLHKEDRAQEMMETIRRRYPSPAMLMESNTYMLKRAGLPRLDAFFFSMMPHLARRTMSESFGRKPRLNNLMLTARYLRTLYIGVRVECFYLILLDRSGNLIDAVLVQQGNHDSAPFYMKQVLSIAVQRRAFAIVLSHNHPGGTARPSREDLACTLKALQAVNAMGMPMLDHVIIAGEQAVSIRQICAFSPELWTMQAPGSALMRNWLEL